jgi:hypothetical protein
MNEWSKTIQNVKSKFKMEKWFISVHDWSDNSTLLGHTITLFNNESRPCGLP